MKPFLRRFISLLLPLAAACSVYAQQDPEYSMYMFDKMAINPAAAGSRDATEATLISRDQWTQIPGAPQTNALMVEAPFASQKVGWGLEFMNDNVGPTSSNSIQGNYAYHMHLFKGQLALGLGLGIYDYDINFGKINYKDASDPMNTYANSQKIVPNADFGVYYYSNTFYAGFSFNHLIQGQQTSNSPVDSADFRPHAYLMIGKGYELSDNVLFSPSIIAKVAENSPVTADFNADFLLQDKLWLGAGYRTGYGFTFLAAYRALGYLQIGFDYDLGLNAIGQAGGGTYELSVTVDFGKRKMAQVSPRYL
jgi:type IX secretion system PorP/SprF family membrane protein